MTKPDPGRCPHCQKQYGRHIHSHIKAVHLKIKPFKCEQCEIRCTSKGELVKHVKVVHLKIKPFKCQYCELRFSSKYGRTEHANSVHFRLKPHVCEYCNARFARNSTKVRHVTTLHAEYLQAELIVEKVSKEDSNDH